MLKNIAVISIALIICACSSSDPVTYNPAPSAAYSGYNHWVTLPGSAALNIIGVSGRQSSRENEIAIAREDAAKKAAMYHGILADFEIQQNTGVFGDFIVSNTSLEYDRELEKYMDRLVFDPEHDVIAIDNAVFIRFTYPAVFPGNISYTFPKNQDGSPGWIIRQPREINGFSAGVGFALRQQRLNDTIAKSYEAAVVNLISHSSSLVTTNQTVSANQSITTLHQQSTGKLEYFVILETWIDPYTQAVRTLVIAQDTAE